MRQTRQAANIYLAFYKGEKNSPKRPLFSRLWWQDLSERFIDWTVRKCTHGQYSHCEIVVRKQEDWGGYDYRDTFDCYTSSPRDGGVRCKTINPYDGKWDLIELQGVSEAQIQAYFNQTQGAKYDWFGVLGFVCLTKHSKLKFFCSEWCFNAITGSDEGWRFSPNSLATILRNKLEKAK